MIKSYKQLTGKYLKSNRKRTLLTIIGIVLSVALISTIGLFFKGIQNAEIEQIKNRDGSYHLMFSKADEALISKVTNNPKVSRSGLFTLGEEIKMEENLVVNEMIASDKALELLPYRVKEGKMPENKNEIVIEKWVLRKIDKNAAVGSKIKIKDNEYTLSGILEDNVNNQIDGRGVLLSKSNDINKENAVLLVEISSGTNLKTGLKELKQLGKEGTVSENTFLVGMQGGGDGNSGFAGIFMVLAVIIGIVVISTIAVIYNSFQISVVERIKQFGLLRAVGTTPKQIRTIVLREATLLAAIGIPIGLLCGIIAIYGISIAFKIIGGDSVEFLKPSISPMVMGISALVGIVSIYISAFIPSFFAGRISPLVAISSRTSITKENIKRRKTAITGKIFGFEGAMAVKNMKRNRKRYRITVFSIIISVVLFITFKSFMDMSFKISDDLNESKNIHFSVIWDDNVSREGLPLDSKIIESIESSKYVDKVYKVYTPYYFKAAIDKDSEIKEIQDIGGIYNKTEFEGKEKTLINGTIAVYDNNSLEVSKKYIESGNIDIESMNRENGVILINKNRIFNEKTKKTYYGPAADVKVGDEIYLRYNDVSKDKSGFDDKNIKKVKVMAILKNEPFNFRGDEGGLKIITTEDMAQRLTEEDSIRPVNLRIIIKDIKNEEAAKTEIEDIIKSTPGLRLINIMDINKNEKSEMLMIQILIYGFVIVVSLIGSVNIVNTLTTNLILRRREFAALKAIGLTQRGLKKMIVLEGFMYGIVGTLYGSIIACGISYVMFRGLVGVREFGWSIPWDAIAIAGACTLVIGYLSVLSPLSRIKKENLIDAIREE